jgi:hypothetical protein
MYQNSSNESGIATRNPNNVLQVGDGARLRNQLVQVIIY